MLIDRFELLYDIKHDALAKRTVEDIKQISPETEVVLHVVNLENPWDFEEVYSALHDFTSSYKFDPDNEEYLIHITTGTHVAQICMYLLTEAHYFPGKLIQTSPSRKKSANIRGNYTIIDLDLSRYDRIASRFKAEALEATSFLKSGITTKNKVFNQLIDQIEQVTIRTKSPMLLLGPTGAGKSHLARRIYDLKKNRHQVEGPFVEVNCATLRGDGAMSALFGHKKGSFTGAANDRAGLLKTADQGVLFLDEIGELGLDEQAMILRAIEEKRFLPVGADQETQSNFQLLAGTNQNLIKAVQQGKFREDLLARLNLWTFNLPGLKDRREDIEPNIDYELKKYAKEMGQKVTFNKEARDKYLKYALSPNAPWSANFRDLSASITRMSTFADSGRINVIEVEREILRLKETWAVGPEDSDEDILREILDCKMVDELDLFDKIQLNQILKICRAEKNLSAAGRKLFAVTRTQKRNINDADRLRKYLQKFGITWQMIAK